MPRSSLIASSLVALLVPAGCGSNAPPAPTGAPAGIALTRSSYSFGMCQGQCAGVLEIAGATLAYHTESRDRVRGATHTATLTEAGQSELNRVLTTLADQTLDARYGCPDCGDGGASVLGLVRDGQTRFVYYDYGRPPAVLAEIDGLTRGLREAIAACASNEHVAVATPCEPMPSR